METNSKYLISPDLSEFNKFSPKLKIGVLASGNGSNFQALIDNRDKNKLDIEIKVLITNKKNAGCLKRAINAEIPYVFVDHSLFEDKNQFEKKIINELREKNVELIVMAGWMKIVSPEFVNAFKNRIINIHPSLLPSFKGKNAIDDALSNGSQITGCSVHFVEPAVDSGKLIIQAALPIKANDNKESLINRIHDLEHKILPYAVSSAGLIIRRNYG